MIIVKDTWVDGIKKMEGEKNGKKRKAEEMVDEEKEDDDQVKMMKLPDGRRYIMEMIVYMCVYFMLSLVTFFVSCHST